MTYELLLYYVLASVAILGIGYLYFVLYPELNATAFRYRLHDIEEELEASVDRNLIPREHSAYKFLKGYLHGMHYLAGSLSLFRIVLFGLVVLVRYHAALVPFQPKWEEAAKDLSEEKRRVLERYRWRARYILTKHTMLGSPIFSILVIALYSFPLACARAAQKGIRSVYHAVRTFLGDIVETLQSSSMTREHSALSRGYVHVYVKH